MNIPRLLIWLTGLAWTAAAPSLIAQGRPLSPLAPEPDWQLLNVYQETITRETFSRRLEKVYAPRGAWKKWITLTDEAAIIRTRRDQPSEVYRLRFAASDSSEKPVPRYWRRASDFKNDPADRPLKGVRIALDPGHLGGEWAQMEERWFKIGGDKPVTEGDMVLTVGRHLEKNLQALGAEVLWVRATTQPVTSKRPSDLEDVVREEFNSRGIKRHKIDYAGSTDPTKMASIKWNSELFFYRNAEIRARAERVNTVLKPDLVVCLHFNAEGWGNPDKPELTRLNHFHALINGCYSSGELAYDDVRFEMLLKLLDGSYPEELGLTDAVARVMARETGLPPYLYLGSNALRVNDNAYVWARNLLANRLYLAPTVFLEPYVMNSQAAYDRIQMGDYEGMREVEGRPRPSIFREYADAVARGIGQYFKSRE